MGRVFSRRLMAAVLGAVACLTAVSCGSREPGARPAAEPGPATAEEKRARGETILKQMSEKLAAAQVLSVSTSEQNERVRRNGEKVKLNFNREVAMRRPDRLYFKATGDRDLEAFYDGKKVTLVSHKEKVFGEFPARPTIDETVDDISDRYDIPLPLGKLLTANPQSKLVSDDTTGGWARREDVDGVACNVISWQQPSIDWSVWVPASGEPLPKKFQVTSKARRGQPTSTIVFKDWNLAPQVTDETFARRVPNDYEGIPIIQRESAVLGEQKQGQGKPSGQAPTPSTKK